MNIKNFLKLKLILLILSVLTQTSYTQSDSLTKDNLNLFLNGLLDGGLIGVDMEDFTINEIDYSRLSDKVKALIVNYQSDQADQMANSLKSLGSVFALISKQAQASQFTGPTADLINKFAVPLLVPGEFIFTPKTSLIIYQTSLSDEIWKGEIIDNVNLAKLGEKLGSLAAKLYYNGKFDFDILFPLAFPSLRFLENIQAANAAENSTNSNSHSTWTKKNYQQFENESLFNLRKNKLGIRNPNHAKQLQQEETKLNIKVIKKQIVEQDDKIRNLQTSTNPPTYDFRTSYPKCCLEVRDQQGCGSCWAFSASGAFEKRHCQSSKQLTINRFSPQMLVSCSTGDYGCDGGTLYGSWNHLQSVGIALDACVPYIAQNGVCPNKCADGSALSLFRSVPNTITLIQGNVEKIKTEIINGGPVQATFVEIYYDFFSYSSGVYVSDKQYFMGYHAMQIIGWGDGYWIVENSWSQYWGDNGTIKIAFDQINISNYVIFATPQVNKDKESCPLNCLSCSDGNTCIQGGCAEGYLNDANGACVKCPENCSVCTSIACPADKCNIGFRNDSATGACLACPANCGKCNEKGCLDNSCLLGFGSDGKGGCVKCSDNCSSCDAASGCKACNEGFSLDKANNTCNKCDANCVSCTASGCLACATGFYKNSSDGTCSLTCPENCKTCSKSNTITDFGCSECNSGFSRTLNGDCIKCPDSNRVCVKCAENCKSCKASGCVKCVDGFAIDSTTKSCKKCSDNCLLCNEKGCVKCAENFNISSAGKCYKCASNCLKCNEKGCINGFCEKGFGIDGKGGCLKCADNCSSCANNLCSFCNNGFYLSAQKDSCVACSVNCLKCDSKGCLGCKDGFYLSSGKCVACTNNCSSCVSNKCLKCLSGFKLSSSNVGNTCVKSA